MVTSTDNVTPLKTAEEVAETVAEDAAPSETPPTDLAKIAIVVSLLSLVLSVIFFFGLNRNLSGLSNEVKDIGAIRTNVAALDSYVDGILEQMGRVNTRIMELEEQPRKEAVRVLQESMIDDMLRRAEFMSKQLAAVAPEDSETSAKLARLQKVLQEFRAPEAGSELVAPGTVAPPVQPAETKPGEKRSAPEQGASPEILEPIPAPTQLSDPAVEGPAFVPAPPLEELVPAPEATQPAP